MKRICESCGAEQEEHWMMSYNSGRKVHWYCWECWKSGQADAVMCEIERRRKAKKEANKK